MPLYHQRTIFGWQYLCKTVKLAAKKEKGKLVSTHVLFVRFVLFDGKSLDAIFCKLGKKISKMCYQMRRDTINFGSTISGECIGRQDQGNQTFFGRQENIGNCFGCLVGLVSSSPCSARWLALTYPILLSADVYSSHLLTPSHDIYDFVRRRYHHLKCEQQQQLRWWRHRWQRKEKKMGCFGLRLNWLRLAAFFPGWFVPFVYGCNVFYVFMFSSYMLCAMAFGFRKLHRANRFGASGEWP